MSKILAFTGKKNGMKEAKEKKMREKGEGEGERWRYVEKL